LEAATTPAASTAATDMFSIRLDIGFLHFFGPRHRFTEAYTATRLIVREICDRNSACQFDPSRACKVRESMADRVFWVCPAQSGPNRLHTLRGLLMLSHVHLGITDFERALVFYRGVMDELGFIMKFCEPEKSWAGWMRPGADRPLFLIGHPYNGEAASSGNGQMVALLAPDRDAVDRCYARALASGARSEGEPGLRPYYHPNYYGAYFRDLDGNKLCVCCHDPAKQ
jgi:catechol 2,3-dioxygenase-like lactoylglutathione lyase family enzyme